MWVYQRVLRVLFWGVFWLFAMVNQITIMAHHLGVKIFGSLFANLGGGFRHLLAFARMDVMTNGFKHFLCSSPIWGRYFSIGLKPPTRNIWSYCNFSKSFFLNNLIPGWSRTSSNSWLVLDGSMGRIPVIRQRGKRLIELDFQRKSKWLVMSDEQMKSWVISMKMIVHCLGWWYVATFDVSILPVDILCYWI